MKVVYDILCGIYALAWLGVVSFVVGLIAIIEWRRWTGH